MLMTHGINVCFFFVLLVTCIVMDIPHSCRTGGFGAKSSEQTFLCAQQCGLGSVFTGVIYSSLFVNTSAVWTDMEEVCQLFLMWLGKMEISFCRMVERTLSPALVWWTWLTICIAMGMGSN